MTEEELKEAIEEMMLTQALKELLYSFRKNGGSLDECVSLIREDFKQAGWVQLDEVLAIKETIEMMFPELKGAYWNGKNWLDYWASWKKVKP